MFKKMDWKLACGSVLAIVTITVIGIGLIAVGSHAVSASPAASNLNVKVKTCKVDTGPDPVSCKSLLKSIRDAHSTFDLLLEHVGGEIQIVLTPTQIIR
jgi:hypothetical protein